MPRRNRQRGEHGGRWGSPRKRPRGWEAEDLFERPIRRPPRRSGHAGLPMISTPTTIGPEPLSRTCGHCREWFPDDEGGRGTCEHPGSGFLRPWFDTEACPFFRSRG
jgi:hypothetical protein